MANAKKSHRGQGRQAGASPSSVLADCEQRKRKRKETGHDKESTLKRLWRLGEAYRGFCPFREAERSSPSERRAEARGAETRSSSGWRLPPIRRIFLVKSPRNPDETLAGSGACCDHKRQKEAAGKAGQVQAARDEERFCSRCFYESFVMTRTPVLVVPLPSDGLPPRETGQSEAELGRDTDAQSPEPQSNSHSSCSLSRSPSPRSPSSRSPCDSAFVDVPLLQRNWLSASALKQRAGDMWVDVEERERTVSSDKGDPSRGASGAAAGGANFGKGAFRRCRFGDFIDRLEAGDESLYLTTQRVPHTRDGPKRLCGAPLSSPLALDFPPLPSLLGNLQPYQYNFWWGHAKSGSTTGLHHDFHDNLYVLLRGQKVFRLFSPRCAGLLPTKGRVTRVYPNGLICYSAFIREDGGHELGVRRWRQEKVEERLALLQERLEACGQRKGEVTRKGEKAKQTTGEKDAEGQRDDSVEELELQIAEAERELDDLLDQALEDMDDESEEDSTASESEEPSREATSNAMRVGRLVGEGQIPDHFCLANTCERALGDSSDDGGSAITPETILSKYWEVKMVAGDMLYLPAGWFHEVHSFSRREAESGQVETGTEGSSHMALNFWFHPPVFGAPYERPYGDAFWEDRTRPLLEAHCSLIEKFGGSVSVRGTFKASDFQGGTDTLPASSRAGEVTRKATDLTRKQGLQKETERDPGSLCVSQGTGDSRRKETRERKRVHSCWETQTAALNDAPRFKKNRLAEAWQAHCALKYAGRRCLMYRVPPELCYFFDSS
ncbi:putative ion channel protein [Toxoplasma gondii TgCatPRC2]|uniref:Putative ion channel protein n=1 Tax=Toxoplasma gondii TgCatPRC2 TaxID=1130821 RepID=A0A151HIZ1_TOXGO|nr:putative ion channel protein [Toxoplasma gondii TgCatPRC2]